MSTISSTVELTLGIYALLGFSGKSVFNVPTDADARKTFSSPNAVVRLSLEERLFFNISANLPQIQNYKNPVTD